MKIVQRDIKNPSQPRKLDESERDWLFELRKYLPEVFDYVSDYELYDAYSKFSDDFFCAGWMCSSQETTDLFVASILILKEDGSVIDPSKK